MKSIRNVKPWTITRVITIIAQKVSVSIEVIGILKHVKKQKEKCFEKKSVSYLDRICDIPCEELISLYIIIIYITNHTTSLAIKVKQNV